MKITIATITAIHTTMTIQKISSKSQSICGPKVEMSCGKYMCSSIEASPLRNQRADRERALAAPVRAADATFPRLPIHGLDAIMPVRVMISEMKNPCLPPQPALNQPRHDAHISPTISSISGHADYRMHTGENRSALRDWRRQIFGLQG